MHWARAFVVWLLIIAAEALHGALRVAFLEPLVGDLPARQICVFSGALIVMAIAYVCSSWLHARSRHELLCVGVFWFLLTLVFEIGIGRAVLALPWDRIAADYDAGRGGLLLFGLMVLLLSPLMAADLRRRS